MSNKAIKPLGRKNYGSIGHIATSRLGPGDYTVDPGQTEICVSNAKGNKVYVQTKLDGSNVGVAKLSTGEIVALSRSGYPAYSSPFEMHHLFANWVWECEPLFSHLLNPGERIVGEWLAQAHGTIYDLTDLSPFVAFDIMIDDKRFNYDQFMTRVGSILTTPDTVLGPMEPEAALSILDSHGADSPEGVVYRVEKKGIVSFLAKWVRPGKEDGIYLKSETPIWNWRPSRKE